MHHTELAKRRVYEPYDPSVTLQALDGRAAPALVCSPRPARNRTCGKTGGLKAVGTNLLATPSTVNTLTACQIACQKDTKCQSIGFDSSSKLCTRYKADPITMQFRAKPGATTAFYQRKCFLCKAPTTTTSSTTSTRSSISTTTTVASQPTTPSSCDPPSAKISGCPAISYCDADFDSNLDKALGFFDPANGDAMLSTIAPGLPTDTSTETSLSSHALVKRGFFSSLAKKIAKVCTALTLHSRDDLFAD